MKIVLRPKRSRNTKFCLSRPQMTLEGQVRRFFQTEKMKRVERRFAVFLGKLSDISLHIYQLLPSIKYRHLALYFQHTLTPCIRHQCHIVLEVTIRKVHCLNIQGFPAFLEPLMELPPKLLSANLINRCSRRPVSIHLFKVTILTSNAHTIWTSLDTTLKNVGS